MKDKKSREKTKLISISTPLGRVKIPVEIAEDPITEQIAELLDDDEDNN